MRFAYDRSGSVIAGSDGEELLVWAGADERPLWRRGLGAPVRALATTVGEVLALDGNGQLHRFDAMAGTPLGTTEVGAGDGLAVARDGLTAVLGAGAIQLFASGRRLRHIEAPEARVLALRDDGGQLATGGADGQVRLYDLPEAAQPASVVVTGEVHALVWNVRGFWLAAAGDRLLQLGSGGRADPIARLAQPVLGMSASADGGLVACQVDPRTVEIYLLPQNEKVGQVGWPARSVEGVAFGPDVWLGAALDGGDANKVNLATAAYHRTDPHQGRARTSWEVVVEVDKERIKAVRSTANPSADAVRAKLAQRASRADAAARSGSGAGRWIALAAIALVALTAAYLAMR